MPEGHTIHRLARRIKRDLAGAPVAASSPQGRFAGGAVALDGHVLGRTDVHGKHLFLGFRDLPADSGTRGWRWVHIHLGLYGSLTLGLLPAPPVRGALRLRLVGDRAWADLRGATACELYDAAQKDQLQARLGPDPLRRDADPDLAYARLSRSRVVLGALLLDQAVVSGVGNVFRAELLFRASISPWRTGRQTARPEWDALWTDLRRLMRVGVRRGRIVTTEPVDRDRPNGPARREDAHYVYGRAGLPCRLCGTPLASAPMVGRTVYWCPSCQAA